MQQTNVKFVITNEQIEKLRPYLPNIDELVQKDIGDFQEELNDAIVYWLDSSNGYEHTTTSLYLEELYDLIYEQNKKDESEK